MVSYIIYINLTCSATIFHHMNQWHVGYVSEVLGFHPSMFSVLVGRSVNVPFHGEIYLATFIRTKFRGENRPLHSFQPKFKVLSEYREHILQ